ncbi:MAG: helix-turn-helix transcriptional regulator [Ruminiclostridium sp.]|nr:helix-turn-helix transcriptional regulator [Ruminiclostridium sp.]
MENNILELLSTLSDGFSAEDLRFADIASDLASQITTRRIELGLTQTALAEKLGRSQATISKWENADCNFQIKTLIEISQQLELPLTISFKNPQPKTEAYYISPTPAADAARICKYISASSPGSSWFASSKA